MVEGIGIIEGARYNGRVLDERRIWDDRRGWDGRRG